MGTNYYIETDFCGHCNRGEETYHIGKSSMGWCFSLHVDHSAGIFTLGDIRGLMDDPNNVIVNEYRELINSETMMDIITNRGRDERTEEKPYGYDSWDEFHQMNGSEMGPNNMLRSKIDGFHCAGHGDGPYVYIVGEFC